VLNLGFGEGATKSVTLIIESRLQLFLLGSAISNLQTDRRMQSQFIYFTDESKSKVNINIAMIEVAICEPVAFTL
jgi:hypothetical protein